MSEHVETSRPLVSFATTAYRTEHYVGATIASVLAQTDPDWELVVVDNGCVDTMAAVVEPYTADPRVRLVRQDNKGYIGGLEAAVAAATGEWVIPVDSDDQVVPHFVERLRTLREEHPAAVGFGCDAHLFSDERDEPFGRGYDRSIGVAPAAPGGELLTRRHLFAGRTPYYGGAIRRDAWQAIGGYVTSTEDIDEVIDFWLRLLDHGEVVLVPDRLGRYRVRGDSLTRDPETIERYERMVYNTFIVHGSKADSEEREAAQHTMSTVLYYQALRRARSALLDGDVDVARHEAREALRHRRTPRALAVNALVTVAPRLLIRVHPWKQRLTQWTLRHVPGSAEHAEGSPPRQIKPEPPPAAPRDAATSEQQPGRPPTSS